MLELRPYDPYAHPYRICPFNFEDCIDAGRCGCAEGQERSQPPVTAGELIPQMRRAIENAGVDANWNRPHWTGLMAQAIALLEQDVQGLARAQYLIDFLGSRGLLEEGTFTFPDGQTWEAREDAPELLMFENAESRQQQRRRN